MRLDFENLAGHRITGVCFIHDYIEITFDVAILRCLTLPVLNRGGADIRPGDSTYEKRMVEMLHSRVSKTRVVEGAQMTMNFGDSCSISISLKEIDKINGEAAHFVSLDSGILDVF